MSDLKSYLTTAGELPRDVLLGYVCIYTIADRPEISPADLEKRFVELNLDTTMLPRAIQPIDSFAKATSSIDGHGWPMSNGMQAKLLCRDVANGRGATQRALVREIVDKENVRLTHGTIVDCVFYKAIQRDGTSAAGSERMNLTARGPEALYEEEKVHVQATIEIIRNRFDEMNQTYDGQALRRVIRTYMLKLDGIELKGSVYFIPSHHMDTAEKLQELLNGLGGSCQMNLMPLVDIPSQRQWIVDQFQNESLERLKKVASECRRVMDTRKTITEGALTKLKADYTECLEQAQRYQTLIKSNLDVTTGAAEFTYDALLAVQRRFLNQED